MADVVPAWRVQVFALAISNPIVAAKVGWIPSVSHPTRIFRSRRGAERYAGRVAAKAKWSLIPIQWRGEITETVRTPDIWDKLRARLAP